MGKYSRDIILLVRDENILNAKIEMEVKNLHALIASVETLDVLCKTHELVTRNRITRKKYKIADVIKHDGLKPFSFLINKN